MTRVRVTATLKAQAQFREAVKWSKLKFANPALLKAEFKAALSNLADNPEMGPCDPALPGVRKLLLRRTRHYLYYRVDRARRVVEIVAFWHTSQGSGPPL